MSRFLPLLSSVRLTHRYIAIKELLLQNKCRDQLISNDSVAVRGWIRSVREHKEVAFVDVNDGSCHKHIQVVIPVSQLPQNATYGSSVEVSGKLVPSLSLDLKLSAVESLGTDSASNPTQHVTMLGSSVKELSTSRAASVQVDVNLEAEDIKVIGTCDSSSYPFKARKQHPLDYLRQFTHLRPRTSTFGAVLRLRNAATQALHQHLQKEGFLEIQTPIITTNDCEGAGEVFTIQGPSEGNKKEEKKEKSYFGQPSYLTVSAQLHLEVAACALGNVYTMGPTFRAENSRTRHHLSEFTMLEAEMVFTESVNDITQCVEKLLKYCAQSMIQSCGDEFQFFVDRLAPPEHSKVIEKIISKPYLCMTYSEAVDILLKTDHKFENKVSWGEDLQKEHERYLVSHCDSSPVFVTHYPTSIKPFYAKLDQDPKTMPKRPRSAEPPEGGRSEFPAPKRRRHASTAGMYLPGRSTLPEESAASTSTVDLLMSGVGEVCGGSLREDDVNKLEEKISKLNLQHQLDWYLDLRRFGTVPHGGFGVGVDRFIQCLLGLPNIKDVVPFPRSPNHCPL